MLEKPPSKNDALEAVDFIVSVLKEHQKDLDKLISGLDTAAEQLGEKGEFSSKLEKIHKKLDNLETEISNITKRLPNQPREKAPIQTDATQKLQNDAIQTNTPNMLAAVIHCAKWEDFQLLAAEAQIISFKFLDNQKILEMNALKDNKIVTYSGELPKLSEMLRMWLSKKLDVSETRVLEGDIALG
jgi:seryl-tRNA synthetase